MDNGKGIAGVAQVSYIAEKVLSAAGSGSYYSCSQGITHAVDICGADVESMSFGGSFYSTELEAACLYAWDAGAVLVAAAGNSGDTAFVYPARYEPVICVGAIDESDSRIYFSCYGPSMELAAPGENILSTLCGNDYASRDGTSMAAPHVAGVAALVMSYNSGASNSEIRTMLQNTANDLGVAEWDQYYGYGKVNASAAVNSPVVPTPVMSYFPTSHHFGSLQEWETENATFAIRNSGADTLDYSLCDACGWLEVDPTSGSSTGEQDTITVSIATSGLAAGTHTCNISISSNGGSGTFSVSVNIIPSGGNENDWGVRLEAKCDFRTDVAEFGQKDAATDGFDLEFDVPKPPQHHQRHNYWEHAQ